MSDLEDVLNGESEEKTETEKPPEKPPQGEQEDVTETETEDAKGEEETDKEASEKEESESDEKKDEPPSSEDKDAQESDSDKTVPRAALQDERRKRQELERQYQDLQARIANNQAPTDEQRKDFWDDPEGYIQNIQQQTQSQVFATKLEISESMARDRWEDFDERFETFKELAQKRPSLVQEAYADPNPGKFVYETAKEHERLREIGDVTEYKEKLEKDFDRRVKEEAERLRQKALEEEDKLPGSAADARQAAGRSESDKHANAAPPSLDEIVNG